MHHLASLLYNISLQRVRRVQFITRARLRSNLWNELQVKISYQIASVSNGPFRFNAFKQFSPGQTIVSNSGTMHHLSPLFSNFLSSSKISFQIPSQCTIYRTCFHLFSAFPNCLKYCHKAHFTSLVFIKKMFCCSSKSLNTTRVHALKTFFLCSSK